MISLCYFLPRIRHVTQSFVTQTSWSSGAFLDDPRLKAC